MRQVEASRNILDRMDERDLYKVVGEVDVNEANQIMHMNNKKLVEDVFQKVDANNKLKEEDLVVVRTKITLGLSDKSKFYFVNADTGKISEASSDSVVKAIPESSRGHVIRFLCKRNEVVEEATLAVLKWKQIIGI